ncbi:hypothetical protein CMV_020630 [Castanea mollissima]|uniref:Uncharacterized protein n=1 Tax=Castanea mollissima TaxID=60419 RepID=A0A8J4QL66_9ROSI|nr:hypothetical protein CMV_020630 [Castanea mollissima]
MFSSLLLFEVLAARQISSLGLSMGNKPVKQQERDEILLKVVPPLDHAYVRWLARDVERIHGFTPKNPSAVKPPEHYIEYMRLNGWLDVNLDDPDLAHLFNFGIRRSCCFGCRNLFWNNHNEQVNKNPNKFQLRLRALPRRFGPSGCANLYIA